MGEAEQLFPITADWSSEVKRSAKAQVLLRGGQADLAFQAPSKFRRRLGTL
jgi:hypothetical protein